MKKIAKISAATMFMSVMASGSPGAWGVLAVLSAAVSLAVLFYTCERLGYFYRAPDRRPAQVIELDERRPTGARQVDVRREQVRLRAR